MLCQQSETEDTGVSQEGVPPGYEAVSLIEALNGPNSLQAPTLQMPPDGKNLIQYFKERLDEEGKLANLCREQNGDLILMGTCIPCAYLVGVSFPA